jgi:hypothetical protein
MGQEFLISLYIVKLQFLCFVKETRYLYYEIWKSQGDEFEASYLPKFVDV